MSWPFVTKARHDRELAALERLLAHAEQKSQEWSKIAADAKADAENAMRLHELERRRYDELLQTTLSMKAQGAVVVPVAGSVVEPPAPLPPDPLMGLKALIAEKAGGNLTLRGIMLRQLAVDVAAGLDHDQIEAAILKGTETQGVPQ